MQWVIKRQTTSNKKKQKVMGKKEKVEEPKYSDSDQQGQDNKTYNFSSTSTRAKIETKTREKEGNINSDPTHQKNSDINNRDVCPLCNRPVKMVVECGICNRWFHFKSEITTEERLVKECPHETHYICKKTKNRSNQKQKLESLENNYKKKKPVQKQRKNRKICESFINPPKKKITNKKDKTQTRKVYHRRGN